MRGVLKPEADRSEYRVAWSFPVEYRIEGIPGTQRATAVDVSAGGLQIATDLILRRQWVLELQFTLPATVLEVLAQTEALAGSILSARYAEEPGAEPKPFPPMVLAAQITPGVQQSRGRYLHGIKFKDPDPATREELLRFVHAAQLSKRRMAM